ncbi:MAG: response regulator [Anaerolineae bacterium]|nr:response regulator [Anaerolineae bacterium]
MQVRILIVEDDTLIAMELQDRLQDLGYSVCARTRTAEDAVILAEGLQPSLVLMDIRLRGAMDGVQAAALIRERFDIPIIYLTAYADDATLARAKVTEPYGYIIKPFEERELLSAIEMALYKHKMEKCLRDSERRLSATLYNISDAVISTDAEGEIILANPVAEALLGPLAQPGTGMPARKVLSLYAQAGGQDDEPSLYPVLDVLHDGQARNLAGHYLKTAEGRWIAVEGNSTPVIDAQGKTQGVVVVLHDVSRRLEEEQQREAMQARLYEAQQMDIVAALTSRLAHDFNEHLTTILAAASLILAEHTDGEPGPVPAAAERIRQASRQAAALTQQILALTGEQVRGPRVLDLHSLLQSLGERLATLVGARVTIEHHLWPEPLLVHADPAELEQVLIHLTLNAQEAMPDGGVVTISTEAYTSTADGKLHACLRFSDTGRGMDAHTRAHAFDPFFSTKPGAAGLGLAISKNIVEQLGGWIEIDTALECGSTFTVYVPQCTTGAEDTYEAPSLDDLRGSGQQVLLVEDDAEVRFAVSEMLRAGGYRVVEANSVRAALDLFEADPQAVDMLITDVMLPDRDGLSLADSCRMLRPELPILVTSGLTSRHTHWLQIRSRGYPFLPKPFGLMDLLPAVKEVIGMQPRTNG